MNDNRVTLEKIESKITHAMYLQPTGTLTICVLTLANGTTVTGESACVYPANFDSEIGEKIARKNAVDKCWSLLGYLLKENMYRSSLPGVVQE